MMETTMPQKPGYYWAKWQIAADGTVEGDDLTPAVDWEIVQVNDNVNGWQDLTDADDMERLSVSVCGVQMTQWRDCFLWGAFVAPLAEFGKRPQFLATEDGEVNGNAPAETEIKVMPRGGVERNWWEEYQLLLRRFKKLAKAARQCVEEVDANLAKDDWPVKYRAPFDGLTKLREAIPESYEQFKAREA